MSEVHHVFYQKNWVFLQIPSSTPSAIIPYQIQSTSTTLKKEEITAFLKKETQASFLHPHEFKHWMVGEQYLTLPNSIYDPALKTSYFERVFGPCGKEHTLETYSNKEYSFEQLYTQPLWWNDYTSQQFNQQNGSPFVEFLLSNRSSTNATCLILAVFNNDFLVCISENNRLIFCDIFPYETSDDILYFLITLQAKLLFSMDEAALELYSFCPKMIEEKLLTNLGKIQHFAHLNVTYHTQAYL